MSASRRSRPEVCGIVTTASSEADEKLRVLRVHGSKPKYYHRTVGGNFRLDALQAAILLVKFTYLEKWTRRRIENATLYRELFEKTGIDDILLPIVKEKRHIYNQFVIKVKNKRDELKNFLHDHGIGCEVYYPLSLHMQECFKYLNYSAEEFPASLEAASKTLALPIYPELDEDQMNYVIDIIKKYKQTP